MKKFILIVLGVLFFLFFLPSLSQAVDLEADDICHTVIEYHRDIDISPRSLRVVIKSTGFPNVYATEDLAKKIPGLFKSNTIVDEWLVKVINSAKINVMRTVVTYCGGKAVRAAVYYLE